MNLKPFLALGPRQAALAKCLLFFFLPFQAFSMPGCVSTPPSRMENYCFALAGPRQGRVPCWKPPWGPTPAACGHRTLRAKPGDTHSCPQDSGTRHSLGLEPSSGPTARGNGAGQKAPTPWPCTPMHGAAWRDPSRLSMVEDAPQPKKMRQESPFSNHGAVFGHAKPTGTSSTGHELPGPGSWHCQPERPSPGV